MHGGKAALGTITQDGDDMGGAGLQRIDLRRVDACGPEIAAAGGGHLEGAAHGKAAVVHQKPHQLRRREGVGGGCKALVQPLQRQAAGRAVPGRRVHRGRPLEIQGGNGRAFPGV